MRRRSSVLQQALLCTQDAALTALGVPAVSAYSAAYRRTLPLPGRPLREAAIAARLRAADLVLVGDCRTYPPAQRAFLALVERCRGDPRPLTLALTGVPARSQGAVDRYLGGAWSASRVESSLFGTSTDPAAWSSVAPILEHAREHGIRVVALGEPCPPQASALQRDQACARLLARQLEAAPEARFLVLAGERRLAPCHLPRQLERTGALAGRRLLTVHQDLEGVVSPDAGTRELGPSGILLSGSCPVEARQSHLDALELAAGDALLVDPPAEAFPAIASYIAAALGVQVAGPLSRLRVHTPATAGALFRRKGQRELRALVLSLESAYVPSLGAVYLAGRSFNHAAEEAAHFVRHCAVGPAMERPRRGAAAFYARCLEEALAFAGSRLANPARPLIRPPQWAQLLQGHDERTARVAAFVLAHKAAETFGPTATLEVLPPDDPALSGGVAHGLGYILGDLLDGAVRAGALAPAQLSALFRDPLEDPVTTYFEWLAGVSHRFSNSLSLPLAHAAGEC